MKFSLKRRRERIRMDFNLAVMPSHRNSKNIYGEGYRAVQRLCGLFLTLILVVGCSAPSERFFASNSGDLTVLIDGFRNTDGEAIVSLFSRRSGFPDDMGKAFRNRRVKIVAGQARAEFSGVPYGEYALSVLHDEDGDRQMKKGWLGSPREGFGFSGHPAYKFGAPAFDDAAILLVSATAEITVEMRYDTPRQENRDRLRSVQEGKP